MLDVSRRQRFQREAKAAAKLHHTNIVPVFGVGEHEGMHYLVMQFIQGLGLDEVLAELKRMHASGTVSEEPSQAVPPVTARTDVSPALLTQCLLSGANLPTYDSADSTVSQPRNGPADALSRRPATPPAELTPAAKSHDTAVASTTSLALPKQDSVISEQETHGKTYWKSVADIGVQVAHALQYAHKQRVLHRDIKPANLLIDMQGTVWVTDFGLAKIEDHLDLTRSGDILGTLRYMAPEMFRGLADGRSEIYGLGLTLYELLALKPAFGETDPNILIAKVSSQEPPRLDKVNPAIPRDLVTIVHKAISHDPERRYQEAGELAADMERFIRDEPIKARPTPIAEQFIRWSKRNPVIAGLSISLTLLLLLAVVASSIASSHFVQLASDRQTALADVAQERNKLRAANQHAERLRREAHRYLYVAHMNVAQKALESGDAETVQRILQRYSNPADGEDLRGFEWFYWWNLFNRCEKSISAHQGLIRSVAYSPTGDVVASCGDGVVKLWNVQTGELLATLHDRVRTVRSLAFSPDGQTVAIGTRAGTVQLWSVATAQLQRTLQGQPTLVNALASPATDSGWRLAAIRTLSCGSSPAVLKRSDFRVPDRCLSRRMANSSLRPAPVVTCDSGT